MKYKLAILLALLPLLTRAQKAGEPDTLANRVLADLKDSWTFGVDSNNNTVDIEMYNKYKGLFDPAAKVDDDLDVRFFPGKGAGRYAVLPAAKDFDVYAHDGALQLIKFRIDSVGPVLRLNTGNAAVYEITRTIYLEKPAKYVFQDVDGLADSILASHPGIRFEKRKGTTAESNKREIRNALKEKLRKDPDNVYKFIATATLHITLAYTSDANSPVKIAGIQQTGTNLTCINDDDEDGILNAVDNMPAAHGDFTANGAPDDDLDGVADAADKCLGTYGTVQNSGCPESYFFSNKQLDGAIGLQFNAAKISLPDLNQFGYRDAAGADAMDVLQSRNGSIDRPAPVAGIYADGNFTYFFGKAARRTGISAGFSYARFETGYMQPDSSVYTYKSSDGYDNYRRQITIRGLTEKIAFNVIDIPLQLSYRFKISAIKNWSINLKAGPSLTWITGSSDYKTTIDIGGIYQVDSVNKDKIAYYDYFNPNSTWNVYLTSAGINHQASNPGAAAVFDKLNSSGNYDFAANKLYREQKKLSRLTWALHLSLDGQYRKTNSSPIAIKAGIHLSYAPSIGSSDPYKPIERTTDDYNSVFNSNGRSYYFAYGLSIGLAYSF